MYNEAKQCIEAANRALQMFQRELSDVNMNLKRCQNEENLVCTEEISPNEDYIKKEGDKVTYIVEIYQVESNDIIVCVNSNSAFFDDIQYQIKYDNEISVSDVNIVWTTIMGNTEDAEDDQYSFINIAISSNGEVFSERKINLEMQLNRLKSCV